MPTPLRAAAFLFSLLGIFCISTRSISPFIPSKPPTSQTTLKYIKNNMTSPSTKQSLRLLIMSDTHQNHPSPTKLPNHDVLIHCGDSELSQQSLQQYASSLPKPVIAIAGNMDTTNLKTCQSSNLTYLQDTSTEISNMLFYGSPWTPKFVGEFQLNDHSHASSIWNNLPNGIIDVLITHGPPKGILDVTSRHKRVGDTILKQQVLNNGGKRRVRLHCFGHVHESYGSFLHPESGILFVNAAIFNGHKPFIVDLPFDRSKPPVIVNL